MYVGDVGDIETARNDDDRDAYTTAVYVLTVEDDSDDTPLAELVLVIVPNESASSEEEEEENDGTLTLNSLTFSAEGMQVNFTNNSGAEFLTGARADIVVVNADGYQVCVFEDVQVTSTSVAEGARGTITFSDYTNVPSTSGGYTVTLTIHAGHGDFTVTDTLAVI